MKSQKILLDICTDKGANNHLMNNKDERTTRLAFSLTIFGAFWYLLSKTSKYWIDIFNQIAYTRSLIGVEHILATCIITYILVITFSFLRYFYHELQTYQSFHHIKPRDDSLRKADSSYRNIFKTINIGFIVLFVISFSLLVPDLIIYTIGIYIVIGTVGYALYFKKNTKNITLKNILDFFYRGIRYLWALLLYFYVLFIIVLVGIHVIMYSLYANKVIEVNFIETKEISLEIKMQNLKDPHLTVSITREANPAKKIELKYSPQEMEESVVEVYESYNSFIEDNLKLDTKKSVQLMKKTITLDEYLLEGKNIVEIAFEESIGSKEKRIKSVRIATEIDRHGNSVTIPQKNFVVSP